MTKTEYKIKWHFKHRRDKKRAKKILKKVESYKGKIKPQLIKTCNEYAVEVLGNKVYAPWLYVYSALNNSFKEGWIPDNYYKKEVVPRFKGEYAKLADRNFITPLLFSDEYKLDLGYILNGKFMTFNRDILNYENAKKFLFKNDNKIVYKLENSQSGKGITIFNKKDFDTSFFLRNINSNGVFQKYIDQHAFFSEFTKNSVATLRITTTSDNSGNVSARAAYLRLANSKDTHVASSSATSISIDLNNGRLQPVGYVKWQEIGFHPDSKIPFEDKEVPYFKKCVCIVLNMHKKIPFIGCIGWDLTIDKQNNVQIMEWNGNNNDIKFSEATIGPCFTGLGWENLWKDDN